MGTPTRKYGHRIPGRSAVALLPFLCWLLSLCIPAHAVAEVSQSEVAKFYDEILNLPYEGLTAEKMPLLARVALSKYASNDKVRRKASAASLGLAGAGVGLAGLAPFLHEWGRRREQSVAAASAAKAGVDSEAFVGSKKPSTQRRVREFFAGPNANWGKRLWKVSGVLGALFLLAGLGALILKRQSNRRIQDDRKKFRKVLVDERRKEEGQLETDQELPGKEELQSWGVTVPPPASVGSDDASVEGQSRRGWIRPAFPLRSEMDAALRAAHSIALSTGSTYRGGDHASSPTSSSSGTSVAAEPSESQGQAPNPSKASGGVFIGADADTESGQELSADDVKRLVEIARELRKPAVFYP